MLVSPVDGGMTISPGAKVVMAPGGHRLGLLKLKSALKKGTKVPMTLEFEKAGRSPSPSMCSVLPRRDRQPPSFSPGRRRQG